MDWFPSFKEWLAGFLQPITSYLHSILEGFASVQEYIYSTIMGMVDIAEWLAVATSVVGNLLIWTPIFVRDVIGSMLIIFVVLRIVGRD